MQNMIEEYRLPGGYFYTMVDEEEMAWSPLPLAIVSSVLFPGNTETMLIRRSSPRLTAATLPGAWVHDVIVEERPVEAAPTAVAAAAAAEVDLLGDDQKEGDNTTNTQPEAEKKEKETAAAELRRTVVRLRQQAEQLEETDRMVKKGLEMIAHKRALVQHKRRRHSQWDWCDDADVTEESTGGEEEDVRTLSRPKKSTVEEGDWVWIEEGTASTTTRRNNGSPDGQ